MFKYCFYVGRNSES